MPGKLCTGAQSGNAYLLSQSRAFCEGLNYRIGDTAANRPITDNPHKSGGEDADAWDKGWTIANDAAGGQVSKADAPCCAFPAVTVPA